MNNRTDSEPRRQSGRPIGPTTTVRTITRRLDDNTALLMRRRTPDAHPLIEGDAKP